MIKIFDAPQIKEIDNCTIGNQGISSVDLMERASLSVYEILVRKLHLDKTVYVFAGPGNNGGDALAIARMLLLDKFRLRVFIVASEGKLSQDCKINKERLEHLIPVHSVQQEKDIPVISSDNIIIDGLFGSGLNRPVEGVYLEVIKAINDSAGEVYSIDIPSGLFVEDNSDNNSSGIVKAKEVFTFQFPKLSLLLPENSSYCKKMTVVDIGLCEKCIDETQTKYHMTEGSDLSLLLKDRGTFSHKGNYGKAMIIAGSYGKMGAAVLAAKACLRTGVGLLTMHVPSLGVDILQSTVPEAMVSIDNAAHYSCTLNEDITKYTVGIGPGIGVRQETKELLYNLFEGYRSPIVIDADALNLISDDDRLKSIIPPKSILTPHLVEFERLAGMTFNSGYTRLQSVCSFAKEYDVYIVLKGACSAIVTPEADVYFNSTGNPGMATGGSGDVLTGMITSLLAQGYQPLEAALLGVYLHGYAGDLAVKFRSEISLLPSDIIEYIGRAYKALQNNK